MQGVERLIDSLAMGANIEVLALLVQRDKPFIERLLSNEEYRSMMQHLVLRESLLSSNWSFTNFTPLLFLDNSLFLRVI